MAYTSKYTGEEIDAKLDEVKPVEVVDSLDSEDTTAALSANQGRVLKEMIEELPSGGGAPADLYPTEYSNEFNDDFTS